MPETMHDGRGLSPSDAKLLMCAMLLCGAEDEINPVFSPSVKISHSRRVDEAVRAAYQAMLRPETDTQNATFTMKMKRI